MTAQLRFDAVPDGRDDDIGLDSPTIAFPRPAAADPGGAAAGPGARFPDWVVTQLRTAIEIARGDATGSSLATTLYREWFSPVVDAPDGPRSSRPLAGLYRGAHAATIVRRAGEVGVLGRYDAIGADGWWRAWSETWTPPRCRPGSVRVLLSPRADRRGEVVRSITAALATSTTAWSLACATDPRRASRAASMVLDVSGPRALPVGLLDTLSSLVHPITPPLCLPVSAGAALATDPGNGMSFGEHRCHLIALGLRQDRARHDPLAAIAAVFTAHGVDPARPHGVSG